MGSNEHECNTLPFICQVGTSDQIYHNPIRSDNKREFVDELVVTDQNVLLIQAKDSPNTEQILERTMERKKATFVSHLKKAADQLLGSIAHVQKSDKIYLIVDNVEITIPINNTRSVFGLIVVKEIFNEMSEYYSSLLFQIFEQTGVPCFLLDYHELHDWTINRRDEESIIETLYLVLSTALEKGEFPRIRFWPQPT